MLIQINGKEYVDASKDIIVIRLNQEEKQAISTTNTSDDLFAYFPKDTKQDSVDYHVKKFDDYISKSQKTPAEVKIEALADDNKNLRDELDKIKQGIIKPVPMEENKQLPEAVEVPEVVPEVITPEVVE